MRPTGLRLALAAALAVSAAGALAQAPPHSAMPGVSADRQAMMAAVERMGRDIRGMTPNGDMDRDFVDVMVFHHQGAIDMASLYLGYGRDPALRQMMQRIVADREREIGEFRAWLAEHPPTDSWLAEQTAPSR